MTSISVELGQRIQPAMQGVEVGKKKLLHSAGTLAFNALDKMGILDWFGRQVEERMHKIVSVAWVSPEAETRFVELLGLGYAPVMFGSHFVHSDASFSAEGFAEMKRTAQKHDLGGRLPGAIVTIAKSVSTGVQDRFMAKMFPHMRAFAEERGVSFVEIVREKDEDVYGMEKESAQRFLMSLRRMTPILFPYGSIQAGRHKIGGERDEINGLLELYDIKGNVRDDLHEMFEKIAHIRKKAYFQPFGLSYSYEAQDPDSYRPTPESIVSLYDFASNFLAKHFGFKRVNVRVTLGNPITEEGIAVALGPDWRDNLAGLNGFLFEEVARDILPHERGFYSYIADLDAES